MGKHTPLYTQHLNANAKIVDFAGWEMPLHYGSQLQEHHEVRQKVGMFDVSHMGVVDLKGVSVMPFLRELLANNVDHLVDGKALYTCMLNDAGGVIDDLIVYKIANNFFRLVINAGTREKDVSWIRQHAEKRQVEVVERTDLAMIAVQGPLALTAMTFALPALKDALTSLKPFHFLMHAVESYGELFIARTGYTGEDGFEVILSNDAAEKFWLALIDVHVAPCGLGARDTLRLEAGLNLYGTDMDDTITPLEANLSWTVSFEPTDRNFIGRRALEEKKQNGHLAKLVGLVLKAPGVMRNHQKIIVEGSHQSGEITSGGFSPTLGKSIALARVPFETGTTCLVEIRNKQVEAQVVKPPFVKKGKPTFNL